MLLYVHIFIINREVRCDLSSETRACIHGVRRCNL